MATNPVITQEQARQVTRGRTPLVPLEYEAAVKALAACLTLDEAKYWNDKADALAAWAKIYHSDDVSRKARALKLHAYRRMGILAAELRPANRFEEGRHMPGPLSALVAAGLSDSQAKAARAVAKLPKRKFDREVAAERPRAPTSFRITGGNEELSESWRTLTGRSLNRTTTVNSMSGFACFCRGNDAKALARGLDKGEVENARVIATLIAEWIDTFTERLPKVKP